MKKGPETVKVRAQIQGHPWDLWGLSQLFDGSNKLGISVVGAVKPDGVPQPKWSDKADRDRFATVGYDRIAQLSANIMDRASLGNADLGVIAAQAASLVKRLNGAGRLFDPEYYGVRLTGVTCDGPGGGGSKSLATLTPNKGFTGLGRHPSQAPFAIEVIAASLTDPAVTFVLEAWELPITWASLYLIYDCIVGKVGNAAGIVSRGLLTRKELDSFKAAANLARDFRTGIRHGSQNIKPPAAPLIPLHEGHRLMLVLTHAWLQERAQP